MDDEMEDAIIYELFTAHVHIIWRYLGVTSAGLVELIMPGPGETFKTKIFQPGPFMFLMFLVLVASVVLQSSSHLIRQWVIRAPYLLRLSSVADSTFKKIGSGFELSTTVENVTWEFNDGIAGVYGMQGRRGNMEDRFCVLQDVDVGGKKMSFFGVFDGHGGQFTAEFVKETLFYNTIEKIRQLRSQMNNKPEQGKSNKNKSSNNSNSVARNNSNKKNEKQGSLNEEKKESKLKNGPEKERSSSDSCPSTTTNTENGNNEKDCPSKDSTSKEPQQQHQQAKNDKDATPAATGAAGSKKEQPETKSDKEQPPKIMRAGSGVENLSPPSSSSSSTTTTTTTTDTSDSTSLKKDDTYSNVNFLKRNSIKGPGGNSNNGDTSSTGTQNVCNGGDSQDAGYIDSYGNLNYTKLLTDQILAVDKQVVQICKSRADMSGTTAVVGVLEGELLVIANVGDSRAVMGDNKGSAVPLSYDHKPNQLKERRRIKEAGGFISFTGVWRVAGVLATSRAIGDFPLKEPRPLITAEPDVLTFSLRDHKAQFVILATDGLWDVMSNEEAVSFILPRLSQRDHGASCLARHAYARGSQDNITVTILTLGHLAG
ncbi:hypothetical protein Pcinc_013518 [Petrolisthes cinctipes]|uniref:PPM-type phosphatase domain-containing protein n=1 Tax=Petrolisthes cinctipes TaxID=88211 RepID=A0AAE1FYH5_PETCI|nr:hypothetical protein Pcinc_013518 [Petrolisthes cinctipes]